MKHSSTQAAQKEISSRTLWHPIWVRLRILGFRKTASPARLSILLNAVPRLDSAQRCRVIAYALGLHRVDYDSQWNQEPEFNEWFFTTIQFVFAGNDSEGLRYGTIKTPEKFYLTWKEDVEDNTRFKLDKYLLKMCQKDRIIELMHDFVLFDGGVKKLPRVHQFFGVKTLDLKPYEADMRYLIDSYIQADEPRKISPFDDIGLLDLIVKTGIADAIANKLSGMAGNQQAVAETIENNVRSKIIREQLSDPAFYEKMSALLDEVIKDRKAKAIAYEEYRKRIADIVKKVRPDNWYGDQTKESVIQNAIYEVVNDEDRTMKVIAVIASQSEYRDTCPIGLTIAKRSTAFLSATNPGTTNTMSESGQRYGFALHGGDAGDGKDVDSRVAVWQSRFVGMNLDGQVTALDALVVLNKLSAPSSVSEASTGETASSNEGAILNQQASVTDSVFEEEQVDWFEDVRADFENVLF